MGSRTLLESVKMIELVIGFKLIICIDSSKAWASPVNIEASLDIRNLKVYLV